MAKKSREAQLKEAEAQAILQRRLRIAAIAILTFLPFLFFLILPLLTRHHLITEKRIPESVLLHVPAVISVRPNQPQWKEEDEGAADSETTSRDQTEWIGMRDLEVPVPASMTPVLIERGTVLFRCRPHRSAQQMALHHPETPPDWREGTDLLMRWLMPGDPEEFLRVALRATWSPVRLMAKAALVTNLAIQSDTYEGRWAKGKARGFILPLPRGTGYLGRIFRTEENKPGYCEIAYSGEVEPISLAAWCDVAGRLRWNRRAPIGLDSGGLDRVIDRIEEESGDDQVLMIDSLQRYLDTGDADWLFPVSLVMFRRGFYAEALRLVQTHMATMRRNPKRLEQWRRHLDHVAGKLIRISLDPHQHLHKLVAQVQNLTLYSISHIRIAITVGHVQGPQTFRTTISDQRFVQPLDTKIIDIVPPLDVSLRDVTSIKHEIEGLELVD